MSRRSMRAAALATMLLGACLPAEGDEVRYFDRDGITYRETRQVVRRNLVETHLERRQQTRYRTELRTEDVNASRARWIPKTEYRWEAFWVNRYNPFAQPYIAYRMVAWTRWEAHNEWVRAPVLKSKVVPETITVQVPVPKARIVEDEVVSRVALGPTRSESLSQGALLRPSAGPSVGGIARLDSEPPRRSSDSAWRPASETRRR